MSPDRELALRERYPDLLAADTVLDVGDGWTDILDGMLEKIREVVGVGRLKLLRIYADDGLRVDLRAAQLGRVGEAYVRGQVLRARWKSLRTREGLASRHGSILADDFVSELGEDDYPMVWAMLESLASVTAMAENGFLVTSIRRAGGALEVLDNRGDISATENFLHFADSTIGHADDKLNGTIERVLAGRHTNRTPEHN